MVITVQTQDLNEDGEVHLAVPNDYFLYWGQDLPSNPSARLAIVPGELEWTNTTYTRPANAPVTDPAFYVEWTATFTFSSFSDIYGEVDVSFGEIILEGTGSYYTDTHPGAAIPPFDPFVDLNPLLVGEDIHIIGSDAAEIIDSVSGPSWYEFFGSQIIESGDGDDVLLGLKDGYSEIYAGAGNDRITTGTGTGISYIDAGEGDDFVDGNLGDTLIGGAGIDKLILAMGGASGPVTFKVRGDSPFEASADNDFTQISGFETYDIYLTALDDVVDFRTHALDIAVNPAYSSFNGVAGYDVAYFDATSVSRASLSLFDKIYADFSGSSSSASVTAAKITHGPTLDINIVGFDRPEFDVTGGSADDYFYIYSGDAVLRGGAGNDFLGVSSDTGVGNNIFEGGLGDDEIQGGIETDTAVFSGVRANYTVDFVLGTVTDNVGNDGTDTLTGIEFLEFADQTVAWSSFESIAPIGGFDFDGVSGAELLVHNGNGDLFTYLNGVPSQRVDFGGTVGGVDLDWTIIDIADFDGSGLDDVLVQAVNGNTFILTDGTKNPHSYGGYGLGWTILADGNFNDLAGTDLLLENSFGHKFLILDEGASRIELGGSTQGWTVVAVADLNNNGMDDIIIQNTNGHIFTLLDNNTGRSEIGGTVGGVDQSWVVKGSGNFDGIGGDDLLIETGDGQIKLFTNGSTLSHVGGGGGTPWHAVGAGDLNGNGQMDMVLQNAGGHTFVLLDGDVGNRVDLGGSGQDWKVEAVVNAFNDGSEDLLMSNTSGEFFLFNDGELAGRVNLGGSGLNWSFVGADNINGLGGDDFLMQATSGELFMFVDGGTARTSLGGSGLGWTVKDVADYDGDGMADILIQNGSGHTFMLTEGGAGRIDFGGSGLDWDIITDPNLFGYDDAGLIG